MTDFGRGLSHLEAADLVDFGRLLLVELRGTLIDDERVRLEGHHAALVGAMQHHKRRQRSLELEHVIEAISAMLNADAEDREVEADVLKLRLDELAATRAGAA